MASKPGFVRVTLKGSFGYGTPPVYYGPGEVDAPEGLARALGLLSEARDASSAKPAVKPKAPAAEPKSGA